MHGRGLCGFTGDFIKYHRQGVIIGREFYDMFVYDQIFKSYINAKLSVRL